MPFAKGAKATPTYFRARTGALWSISGLSSRDRVREFIEQKEYWRAKRALQGRLASSGYDPQLFEEYGRVLLLMSDKFEAGKYLFLSGARSSEYAEAIALFMSELQSGNPAAFAGRLPAAARRNGLTSMPEVVKQQLMDVGFPESQLKKVFASNDPITRKRTKLSDTLVAWLAGAFFMLLFGGLVWQAIVGVRAIFNFLFG